MTTSREVPFSGDVTAWVHTELAELKSRMALVQQAAEQSRNVASDAAETANAARMKSDLIDQYAGAINHLQDDQRALRELIVRTQDDIHSLRQSREEWERRAQADAERLRQDRNDAAHRFGDLERQIEGWREQLTGVEEHGRRNLELATQLIMRLETIEANQSEQMTLHSRVQTALARIDQELQRLSATVIILQRNDDEQRERASSALESLRRTESEIESVRAETNRMSRIDDRLELVQAERTRHNERLNDLSAEQAKTDSKLNELSEHDTLLETRIANFNTDVAAVNNRLMAVLDQIAAYMHSQTELESDLRKRQIIALEKEIRDIRSRELNFSE
jgi:chromosome segregation ATPase